MLIAVMTTVIQESVLCSYLGQVNVIGASGSVVGTMLQGERSRV
jgi:hypothetical protein